METHARIKCHNKRVIFSVYFETNWYVWKKRNDIGHWYLYVFRQVWKSVFLWNSNVDKVKRNVVTQNYENCGLKMTNIQNYLDGLKTTWIRRLITTDYASWKNISFAIMDINKLLTTGIDFLNKTIDNIKKPFLERCSRSLEKITRKVCMFRQGLYKTTFMV